MAATYPKKGRMGIPSDPSRWGAENVETRCSRLRCPGGKVGAMSHTPLHPRWPEEAVTGYVRAGMRCWVGDASIASLPSSKRFGGM